MSGTNAFNMLSSTVRELLHDIKTFSSFHVEFRNVKGMHNNVNKNYEKAVKTLNSLQSNANVLQEIKHKVNDKNFQKKKLDVLSKYLLRSGVTLEQLDKLSAIHVSGTKGKGSTCAFCESILRHYNYKTGFYSSPHLVAVRERIRINGKPLSKIDFSKYFWKVYNLLRDLKEEDSDMPSYFQFLTIMAFNVFLAEKVDLAVIEVGIGGEYDCTNILRNVSTIGITSLGLDHTNILGKTVEEIAWQKAGIMKPGSTTFTAENQSEGALAILKERALEKKSKLYVAPSLDSYNWEDSKPEMDTVAEIQLLNMTLALQLAKNWIQKKINGSGKNNDSEMMAVKTDNNNYEARGKDQEIPIAPTFPITSRMASGLKNCMWHGRNQVISTELITYFLDGAHTSESLQLCAEWFMKSSQAKRKKENLLRILIFNCTGNRDSESLLLPLLRCDFPMALFCTNNVTITPDFSSDLTNLKTTMQSEMKSCKRNLDIWCELQKRKNPYVINNQFHLTTEETSENVNISQLSDVGKTETQLFPCVSDVLQYLQRKAENNDLEYHVLVTGSLHLVGSILSILDPDLTLTTSQLSVEVPVSGSGMKKSSSVKQ